MHIGILGGKNKLYNTCQNNTGLVNNIHTKGGNLIYIEKGNWK